MPIMPREGAMHTRPIARISAPVLARILGGEFSGGGILAPGPGQPHDDRSLTVSLHRDAPDGFLIVSRIAPRLEARRHVLDRVRDRRSRPAPQSDLFEAAR
jgi:hypothetical protein